jgi:hypothetical protein
MPGGRIAYARTNTLWRHTSWPCSSTPRGPITIGARSKTGAQALVVESLPADSLVLGHAGSIIHRSAEDTSTTVEQAVDDGVV